MCFVSISSNLNSFETKTLEPCISPVGSIRRRWDSLKQREFVCLSWCLFLSLFGVYTHLCSWPSQVFLQLWQFSAWSPLICLPVYLLSQHSWFIYIYISGKWQRRIIFTSREEIYREVFISAHTPEYKVYFCDVPVAHIRGWHEFYQIWSEVSLEKYDKCLLGR